jgi:hypothetical protein
MLYYVGFIVSVYVSREILYVLNVSFLSSTFLSKAQLTAIWFENENRGKVISGLCTIYCSCLRIQRSFLKQKYFQYMFRVIIIIEWGGKCMYYV